jgi:hypothetical protein
LFSFGFSQPLLSPSFSSLLDFFPFVVSKSFCFLLGFLNLCCESVFLFSFGFSPLLRVRLFVFFWVFSNFVESIERFFIPKVVHEINSDQKLGGTEF